MHIVAGRTSQKYPRAIDAAVGSFLILRFFGPAVVAAHSSSQSTRMQRQLVIVVKILTNLANDTLFKEKHMSVLNDFLKHNIDRLSVFLRAVSAADASMSEEIRQSATTLQHYVPKSLQEFHDMHEALYAHADRIRIKLYEIGMKQGAPIEHIIQKTLHLRRLVYRLGPPQATSGRSSIVSLSESVRSRFSISSTSEFAELAEVVKKMFYPVGTSSSGHSVYYFEFQALNCCSTDMKQKSLQDILGILRSFDTVKASILVDATGFLSADPSSIGTTRAAFESIITHPSLHSLYYFNINTAFLAFFRTTTASDQSQFTLKQIFVDQGDHLERFFDQAVCAHLLTCHGLSVKTFPAVLTLADYGTTEQDLLIRMTLHNSDTIFLSSLHKQDLNAETFVRIVEKISVANITDILVAKDSLTIVQNNLQSIKLRIMQSEGLVRNLRSFLLQTKANELFRDETNENEEKIMGLLLCIGFSKLVSPGAIPRESGVQILSNLLPKPALQRQGLERRIYSAQTPLDGEELRQVHMIARDNISMKLFGDSLSQRALARFISSCASDCLADLFFDLLCSALCILDSANSISLPICVRLRSSIPMLPFSGVLS